jgi:hypothetical protein
MSHTVEYMSVTSHCGEVFPFIQAGFTVSDSRDIRADYSCGHYFSPGAIRFFGMRYFRTVAPGASVQLQENAPAGVGRYAATVWETRDHGGPNALITCHHETRAAANRCAIATSNALRGA